MNYFPSKYNMEIVNEIISQSLILRMRRKDSRRLLWQAFCYLPDLSGLSIREIQNVEITLKSYLSREIKKKYGNPIVIFILLRIILPIVIRLVIKWWLNRR